MMQVRFFLEGDARVTFLSDVDRLIDIVDSYMRENLANIRSLRIFYNHSHGEGIAEYICDTEEDHCAIFDKVRFEFLGTLCTVSFENGFFENH